MVDVQATQCCGVFSSQDRSWCSNGVAQRRATYIANQDSARHENRRDSTPRSAILPMIRPL